MYIVGRNKLQSIQLELICIVCTLGRLLQAILLLTRCCRPSSYITAGTELDARHTDAYFPRHNMITQVLASSASSAAEGLAWCVVRVFDFHQIAESAASC